MQLRTKIYLFTLTMLILLTASIVLVGTYIINDIVYGLNKRLLLQEMNHLVERVQRGHDILVRTGIHTIETYVARQQKQLTSQFREITFGRTGRVYIIDNKGRAVLHDDFATGALVDLPFVSAMQAKQTGFMEYNYKGRKRFSVFRTFPQWNWLMVLSVAQKEMFEKKGAYLRNVSAIAAVILFFYFWVMNIFIKKMIDRVHKTLECANQVKEGNLTARIDKITANDEISDLQHNINAMIVEIERRIADHRRVESALRKSEEQYRALFENAPLGVMLITHQEQYLTVNNALCQMLGYPLEELQKMNTRAVYRFPYKYYEFIERLQKEACVGGFEVEMKRKDQSIIYARLTAVPAAMIGEDIILAMCEDITERKKSEAALKASLDEKKVLLKEIYHRVKNNLEVISSLLYLQSAAIEDEQMLELFKESENRVRSMGMLHEKLYQSQDLARVDYTNYIHGLVDNLLQSYASKSRSVKVKVETQDVSLGVDTAIPCGLIINELVTNAMKYAFPETFMGTAEIRIAMTKGDDNIYTLRVSDNGVGLPGWLDFKKTDSLGIQIVNALAAQLEGTIRVDGSSGTTIEIRFSETEKFLKNKPNRQLERHQERFKALL